MKEKKKKQDKNYAKDKQPLTPEQELIAKEKQRIKNNRIKNRPIVVITYMMVAVFVSMIAYVIYFMQFKSETVIANSRNVRQDSFASTVERGDIITSDGVVIATSETDDEGNTSRSYPYSNMFAHLVGYDEYGKSGLELAGNFYMLRSHINIFERVYRELKEQKNRGDNIITTVDYDLQAAAYNALGGCKGAVIAIEPSTGKILCMVSKPDFDPNDIENVWSYLQTEEGASSTILLNRATQGLYAPGSTFKVVSLLEFIRENPNSYNNFQFHCDGNSIFSGVSIRCSNNKSHGDLSLADALAYSCNVSFATIGETLDKSSYRNTAEELLYNKDLPYDGDYNSSKFAINGNSPDDAIPQTVIGQGDTKTTPLHNAMIMSAIANDGVLMKPYTIDSIQNDDGANVKTFHPKQAGTLMTANEADILTEYMKGVCEYGTGSGYFSGLSYHVAGKTGTAEFDNEGNCNSWFVGFSDPDDPDIVVCAIAEESNVTGVTGAWVARQVFDAYYSK
ncbi:MAG: penicillin-binding transpeptidase domain-containing protein [Clostridium sp.]|nr:penicillin-binding transpeptidase domain-containing protein [Clostridium sp.]